MNNQIISLTQHHHEEILNVWEEAVRATHDFMTEEEITAFIPHLRRTDLPVDDFYGIFKGNELAGFIGLVGHKIELLFIRPAFQGQGLGRQFLDFAVNKKGIYALDVYEDNKRAYDFYTRLGFQVTGRVSTDSLGFAHPVLKMHLIVPLTARDYEDILHVWNESVKATHPFVSAAERADYETCIRKNGLSACSFYGVKQYGRLKGFMALAGDKIEMLFLHPEVMGAGLGGAFIRFALIHHQVTGIDVNEENARARAVYEHIGFVPYARDETDDCGRPHPILHMKWRGSL